MSPSIAWHSDLLLRSRWNVRPCPRHVADRMHGRRVDRLRTCCAPAGLYLSRLQLRHEQDPNWGLRIGALCTYSLAGGVARRDDRRPSRRNGMREAILASFGKIAPMGFKIVSSFACPSRAECSRSSCRLLMHTEPVLCFRASWASFVLLHTWHTSRNDGQRSMEPQRITASSGRMCLCHGDRLRPGIGKMRTRS